MAKKFVRGVTGVDNIEKFDKSLTNINDLISDGKNTYVHTKHGNNETYYNLTDNIKTISSLNNDLIEVTRNNNNVTLMPKHDDQKEQLLESTRNTVTIEHGSNGTSETTKVNTNPHKVLEHENLLTNYGISKVTTGNTTKLGIEYTKAPDNFDLNNLTNGNVHGFNFTNAPQVKRWYYVSSFGGEENRYMIQEATLLDPPNTVYKRVKDNGVWKEWREQIEDKHVINDSLSLKQNTLKSNPSIGVLSNQQLVQLYGAATTYTHANGLLKTHVKNVAENSNVNAMFEEFNFTVKINQKAGNIVVTLNSHDTTAFNKIMTKYGSNNTFRISEFVFTLSGSSLTVSTSNNTAQNNVMSFSDILD